MKSAMILAGGATLFVAGCSTRETQPTSESPSQNGDRPPVSAFEITDQKGRTVSFDTPVERIATTVIPAPSMLIAADQGMDKIVAINKASKMQAQRGFLGEMFPELLNLPEAAAGQDFVPNIETIAAQNPDVVIQWGQFGDDIVAPIEQAGLKLLLILYGTQEDLETWVTMFTQLVGKPERGETILDYMHRDRQAVEEAVAKVTKQPRVVDIFNYDEMQVAGSKSYMDFWITLAGGENVGTKAGSGSSIKVSKEELLSWNPEVVFLGNFSDATPETIYSDPFFADMDAVKNKRVYKIPNGGFAWDPPSNESNLMWQWAASLIHPDAVNFPLRDNMKKTYEYLYNHKLTDEQMNRILAVDANAESRGYDRFR